MPIEIRELIVRATVEPPKNAGAGAAAAQSSGKSGGALDDKTRNALVQECVEQVMAMLKRQRLR